MIISRSAISDVNDVEFTLALPGFEVLVPCYFLCNSGQVTSLLSPGLSICLIGDSTS